MSISNDLSKFKRRVVGGKISKGSWPEYKRWITRFEAWVDDRNRTVQGIVDLEDFDILLRDESRTGYPWDNSRGSAPPASYAYQSRTVAVSAAKKWIRRQYGIHVPESPKSICKGEPEPFDPTYLDPGEVDDIFATAAHDCTIDGCEAALRVSYDAILRASELVRVRREDIDLTAGTVYVRASKGSHNLEVGLADPTVEALRAHLNAHPDRDRPFWNSYGRAWRPSAWVMHVLRKHCDDGSNALGRHSPIMHRLESGQSFGEVYRKARHQNPSQTADYARIVGVDVPDWAGQE